MYNERYKVLYYSICSVKCTLIESALALTIIVQILPVDTRQTQLSKPLRMYLSRSLQTLLWMAAAILKSKPIFWKRVAWQILPKARRTRGLSCAEVNAFLKYPNLTPKRFNKLQLQSFDENLLQNLDKTSL